MAGQITYKSALCITPSEELWRGLLVTGEQEQDVTVLKAKNPSQEWIKATALHAEEISSDRKLGKLVIKCLSYEHNCRTSSLQVDPYLTICYEPVVSTMETFIEQSSTPHRNRAWFQSSGLPTMLLLLLSLKLLHKRQIAHQSISLCTIFFTTDHIFKLGDFRRAERLEGGLNQMRKDLIDLGSAFLYFLGNCTNTMGPPVGDEAVKTAIQSMNQELYGFIVMEMCDSQRNLTARKAYRRLSALKDDGHREIPRNPVSQKPKKPTFSRKEDEESVRREVEALRMMINSSNPLWDNEAKQRITTVQELLGKLGGDLRISGERMEPSEIRSMTETRKIKSEFDEMRITDSADSQEVEFQYHDSL